MKIIKPLQVTILILSSFIGCVFAQTNNTPQNSKGVSKNSYDNNVLLELIEKASERISDKVYRLTKITEKFENNKKISYLSSKEIRENLPPEKQRYIIEKESYEGVPIIREYIYIGRETFVRLNNGEWKIFSPSGSGVGAGSGQEENAKVEFTEEKKFITEILNGQKSNRYEEILRYTYTYPDRIEKAVKTETYWFNLDGLLMKKLYEWNNETKKTISREVEIYEYDLKLKIEKPIVKS